MTEYKNVVGYNKTSLLHLRLRVEKFYEEKHIKKAKLIQIFNEHGLPNPPAKSIAYDTARIKLSSVIVEVANEILDEVEDEEYMVNTSELKYIVDSLVKRYDTTINTIGREIKSTMLYQTYRAEDRWMPIEQYEEYIDKLDQWENEHKKETGDVE